VPSSRHKRPRSPAEQGTTAVSGFDIGRTILRDGNVCKSSLLLCVAGSGQELTPCPDGWFSRATEEAEDNSEGPCFTIKAVQHSE
jgi:hypothetical protein